MICTQWQLYKIKLFYLKKILKKWGVVNGCRLVGKKQKSFVISKKG